MGRFLSGAFRAGFRGALAAAFSFRGSALRTTGLARLDGRLAAVDMCRLVGRWLGILLGRRCPSALLGVLACGDGCFRPAALTGLAAGLRVGLRVVLAAALPWTWLVLPSV